jgi:hypothetical protein
MLIKDKHLFDHLDSITGSLGNVSKLIRELDRKLAESVVTGPPPTPIDGSLRSILGALELANKALVAIFQQAHGVYFPKRACEKEPTSFRSLRG